MTGATFRHATAQDGTIIHSLISELAATLGLTEKHQSSPQDFVDGLSETPPAFRAVIAEQGGDPVGICLYFTSFSTWRGTKGVYVQDLYVRESLRGNGLGRQLLERAATPSRATGAGYLRLGVDADNTSSQTFYEKMGMHWADEDRIYVIDGDAFQKFGSNE